MDFIIWLLFSREKGPGKRPQHLLCDGFRKGAGQQAAASSVQGLYSLYFNERVVNIKQAPWPQLLHLLGKSGESMMINLLLDCSIFLPVKAGQGNYYQLSGKFAHPEQTYRASLRSQAGTPIFECEQIDVPSGSTVKGLATFERKPTDIIFVRSRMLYARAALNARGSIHFGLRHIREFLPTRGKYQKTRPDSKRRPQQVHLPPCMRRPKLFRYWGQQEQYLQDLRRFTANHDVHVSTPIRSAQCFHLARGSHQDGTKISRLHAARGRDFCEVSQDNG